MAAALFFMLVLFVPMAWGTNQSSWLSDYGSNRREFDYFILALQWPATFCQLTHHCCAKNACCHKIPSLSHFTIHGFWPEYNDGSWPQCCNGPSFDAKKIFGLLTTLERDWPSLSCSSPRNCHGERDSFWAHEWEKHGTCAYPVIQDEYSYFSTTLELHSKYNILDILKAAGYPPDNNEEYIIRDLVAAISTGVGATPSLVCSQGQLKELRLCFYKDLKPRDCTTGYEDQSNLGGGISCPQYVMIPEYTSPVCMNIYWDYSQEEYADLLLQHVIFLNAGAALTQLQCSSKEVLWTFSKELSIVKQHLKNSHVSTMIKLQFGPFRSYNHVVNLLIKGKGVAAQAVTA